MCWVGFAWAQTGKGDREREKEKEKQCSGACVRGATGGREDGICPIVQLSHLYAAALGTAVSREERPSPLRRQLAKVETRERARTLGRVAPSALAKGGARRVVRIDDLLADVDCGDAVDCGVLWPRRRSRDLFI